MIESYYWREDLLDHARRLRPVKNPKRWSERALVIFEKELMISFYIVRTLLERDKTSKKSDDYRVSVRCVPWNGRSLTKLNYFDIERLYSFDREFDDKIGITNLSVHKRFPNADLERIRTLKTWQFDHGVDAADEEIRILREFEDDQYIGPDVLVGAGNTELFVRDVLGLEDEVGLKYFKQWSQESFDLDD